MADTVLIACKHPTGLVLNLDKYTVINQQTFQVQRQTGPTSVTLRGYSLPAETKALQARMKNFGRLGVMMEGGYALTPVPVAFWEAWIKKNDKSPLIKDGIILGPHSDAINQALAHEPVEPMFRPLAEDGKDPRVPGVTMADMDEGLVA